MDVKMIQNELSKKFDVKEVKQREAGFGGKKLDYISIDGVINRLNDVLPMGYSWTVDNTVITESAVILTGTLSVDIKQEDGSIKTIKRSGVGADSISPKDMDKSVKTAYAEAFKKACNTLGVGLYLWDAEERAELDRDRKAETLNLKTNERFAPAQLEKMKFIRTSLKVTSDEDLNKLLVTEYKKEGIATKKDFNKVNIEDFFKWAKEVKKVNLS